MFGGMPLSSSHRLQRPYFPLFSLFAPSLSQALSRSRHNAFTLRSEIGANHLCCYDMGLTLFSLKKNEIDYMKTLIAAEYVGVNVELALDSQIPSWFTSYFETNPICEDTVVLQTPDGPIFESNAIARFVTCLKADNPLYGSSIYDYGRVEQYIEFASLEIDANIKSCLQSRTGREACCKSRTGRAFNLPLAEEAAKSALKRALVGLNELLASNTYLVGHSVTLADIVLSCDLYLGFTQLMPKSFTSELPHVERYFWTLVNQPNFKKILGEVKQCESRQSGNMALTNWRSLPAPFACHPYKEWLLRAQPEEAAKSKP